jgi:hypothetical protein
MVPLDNTLVCVACPAPIIACIGVNLDGPDAGQCDEPTPPTPTFVAPKPTKCRHCGERSISRPRGLCWACFYLPDVRALYPAAVKIGDDADCIVPPLPELPTLTEPGTADRVEVYRQRVAAGRRIFHHLDAF